MSAKNQKEKWLRGYQDEIYMNKEKREYEVLRFYLN